MKSRIWMPALLTLCAVFMGAHELRAQVGSTSSTVRGKVVNETGQPVHGVQISVVNEATGVQRGASTNEHGIYIVPFVQPGGPYRVSTQFIGFGEAVREFERIRLGEVLEVDFELSSQAVALEALSVNVEGSPLIETKESGLVDRVGQVEIESLPTNGRNFADFIVLSGQVAPDAGDGTGGNLSIGGGRRGANNILIDGVGNNGAFFGGEARGSDRIAFAFSQEVVKEFQVITNSYDVERGNFTGGAVNAITKNGTNEFEGSFFYFRRDADFTGDGFDGLAPTDFSSDQYGGVISGPIVRDKLHFLLSADFQDRVNPVPSLLAPDIETGREFNIHPDSLARLQSILQNVYGVDTGEEFGEFSQTNDQIAIFGRLDWQINPNHQLTLRNNFTDLEDLNDRLSRNETRSNAGVFKDKSNSFVVGLKSILSPSVFNDFRFQYATEERPRTAYSQIPEADIAINSTFSDRTRFVEAEVFNDGVLPNSLDENTIQIVNNLIWQQGNHTFKVGTDIQRFDLDNFFFFAQFGEFEFDSLEDFQAGRPSEFDLATPGSDGSLPRAAFKVNEWGFYIQDDWSVNDKLTLNLGVRYDLTTFPDTPKANPDVEETFGFDTSNFPEDNNNIAPRFGFTYDVNGDGQSVVRGGAGLFYGRVPPVFWSNSLLNDGVSQGFIRCTSGFDDPAVQAQVIQILRGEREMFTDCPSGGFGFSPNINGFLDEFELPGAWKANLGYDRALGDGFRVGGDVSIGWTQDNYYIVDANVLDNSNNGDQRGAGFFVTDGGRPVFAPKDQISTANGSVGFGANRVDTGFNDVLVHRNIAESRTYSASVELEKRFSDRWSARATYAYNNTKDNSSFSCCISSTGILETPTAGSPNYIGNEGDEEIGSWGPSDFSRPHNVVISGIWQTPVGLKLSGIYRGSSGVPWTPLIGGDANADGRTENDRAFVPASANGLLFETQADASTFTRLMSEFDCLAEQAGTIVTRNSCRNSWRHQLDMRAAWDVTLPSGQSVELIADLFNVLNLLNDDWGKVERVQGSDQELVAIEGFEPVSGRFIYSTNGSFGEETPFGFTPRQWQVQLGARYSFGR